MTRGRGAIRGGSLARSIIIGKGELVVVIIDKVL